MPHLQAVMRPLAVKNIQQSQILQFERMAITVLLHNFFIFSFVPVKKSTNLRQPPMQTIQLKFRELQGQQHGLLVLNEALWLPFC